MATAQQVIEKIDEIKSIPVVGNYYLVPCFIIKKQNPNSDWEYKNGELIIKKEFNLYIHPIINHPHSDKETGQKEIHYHIDYRFIEFDKYGVKYKFRNHYYNNSPRFINDNNYKIEYHRFKLLRLQQSIITSEFLIKNKCKLKHKCIYKGKCPHRGYDLSNEIPNEDGFITCPLHNLKFDCKTLKLI